ncbi:delta-60 repeat domain-containing protein [Urbifossiella limnaea]|uniref:delta-60 repeat domain-containing protein n=1 Tax=Urbifossiella limnaea TaxID=2528023 RepID=UPI0011A187EA|nr:delta-60 repeat domain-containing protein [Urbifossiella limnaea]
MKRRPHPADRIGLERLEAREVPAAAGTFDPSFGVAGVSPDLGGAAAVVVDPLGRVVLAGTADGAGGHDFLVTRLNPDGTPDTTFGTGGTAAVDIAGGDDVAAAVALDAAGRVVVAGVSTTGDLGRFAVARLTAAGAPDPTFGTGGTVAFHVAAGATDTATGVAVDPADGGVVVGGYTTTGTISRFAAARLTSAGILDAGFGGGGVTSFTIRGADNEKAFDLALDPAGRIVLAGQSWNIVAFADLEASVARLSPAGALDATFAGDGTARLSGMDWANAVDTDPAGNVYATGAKFLLSTVLVVSKRTATGAPDPTFHGGSFSGNLPGITANHFVGTGVAVQPDGKVVVIGVDSAGEVFRLTAAGDLDPTFDPGGSRPNIASLSPIVGPARVVVAPGGTIVAAGTTNAGTGKAVRLLGAATAEDLAASGTADGRAAVYTADPTTGAIPGGPAATPIVFPGFAGAVRVATGDVNGDGVDDTVLATGPGTPVRFAVVSGTDHTTVLVGPTDPFGDPNFTGGLFAAAGDLDRDGRADLVFTPDQGGGPRVVIFSLPAGAAPVLRASFFGIDDSNFRGGARPAVGDVFPDGTPDLVVAAGFGGGPRVALFDGRTVFDTPTRLRNDFFAFPGADAATLRNGVYLAAGDIDGDGAADLVFGGGPGGAPRVRALSGQVLLNANLESAEMSPLMDFFVAGDSSARGGVRVAATDLDNDRRADVVAGSGEGSPSRVRVYLGRNITGPAEPAAFQDLDPFGAILPGGVYVG